MVAHSLRANTIHHRQGVPTYRDRLALYSSWLLEVYVILDCMDLLRELYYCMCHITHSRMLEQTDIQLIDSILNLSEDKILTKSSLIKLQQIKNRVTGSKDRECFCALVRRKVWFKDFTQWYEGALG